ncbi:MAG: paraquat-inducible protein A [Rhodopila sp.]
MIIACPDCAALQHMPPPPGRGYLQCCRCERVLERRTARSLDATLACAFASLLLLLPANLLPLVMVRPMTGLSTTTYLGSGCAVIWQQGWPLVAVVLGLQGLILPFVRFGLLVSVLAALRLCARPPWLGRAFRYDEYLDIWAMPDVLLAGGIIGYGRVAVVLPVQLQPGGWCLALAGIMAMVARATLDRPAVWRRIGTPPDPVSEETIGCIVCNVVMPGSATHCGRCGALLHRRKPFSLTRTNALLLTAVVLLPVAGFFPVSSFWELGKVSPRTVIDGVKLLFQSGYIPVGVLISCTSLGAPLLKIGGTAWCSIAVMLGSNRFLLFRTRLYRILEPVGRWSYLDPFSVMVFAPMLQLAPLTHITLGVGSPAFLALLVTTTFAVRLFDPRLMWDRADSAVR